MILIKLFITFFKIGLFGFGGGYGMIPLIGEIVTSNNWITDSEFIKIVAIAEMTPGPIAINAATFVGYNVAGVLGGLMATLGVASPSIILILSVSKYLIKNKDHPMIKSIFSVLRPAVSGLIIYAVYAVTKTAIFENGLYFYKNNITTIIIFFILFIIGIIKKQNPIIMICISAVLGFISFYI